MIAAEGILLDRETEKRLRLSYLLPLFGRPSELSQAEGYQVVQKCYNWRSDYVHSGDDIFPDYDATFEPGEPQRYLYWLRRMVARLLASSPNWIALAEEQLEDGVDIQVSKKAREQIWFRYISNCWESAFSENKDLPEPSVSA